MGQVKFVKDGVSIGDPHAHRNTSGISMTSYL